MRDSTRLRALVRERLERVTLEHAVEEIILRVERFQPLGDTQLDLLDTTRQKDDGWEDLLDKLRARLGDGAVRQLGLKDDHRPERAWCLIESERHTPAEPLVERPLWLVTPRAIRYLPEVMGKPERIETGWWDGEDVQRDYYIGKAPDGSTVWLFRQAGRDEWQLHGLWA
jgi:protein ImuB